MRASCAISQSAPSALPRAVLADDHQMVMEGIADLLKDTVRLVAMAGCGRSLAEAITRTSPDIVISDISMPNGSGIAVLQSVRAVGKRTPFLFLTMHAEGTLVARALELGANGYVLKTAAGEELLRAVGVVVAGGTYVTPMLNTRMRSGFEIDRYHLTRRLREVLCLTARGLQAKQIATHLALSVRTIESHRSTLMQIFDAHSVWDLVRRAKDVGCLLDITQSDLASEDLEHRIETFPPLDVEVDMRP